MTLTPSRRASLERASLRFARDLVRAVLPARDPRRNSHIAVFFVPNTVLRSAKKNYLHQEAKLVDVLAFPEVEDFPFPPREKRFLGEIYLNEVLLRKGDAFSMLVHGVLHLLGYRHEKKRDTMVMEQLEARLCARFDSAARRLFGTAE
jgi:ssRNA-specific RNase YbeY (16S rRNA maturation enzyme)